MVEQQGLKITERTRQLLSVLFATISGSAAVLAFAPIGWQPAALPALMVLFFLVWRSLSPLHAFCCGLAFGFAFFVAGLWWVYDALSGHIGLPVVAAVPLTLLFCLALALFPAAALGLATLITLAGGLTRLLALAACWTLMEWVRSWLFTGFPWLVLGYSQIPGGWLATWGPIAGVLGISLALAVTAACLLALLLLPRRRLVSLLIIALLPATPWLVNNGWQWTTPAGTLEISLLQGNVKQSLKWQPGQIRQTLHDYRRLADSSDGRIIILPETALPMLIEDLPAGYIDHLRTLADERFGAVITGLFLEDERGIYNAAVSLEKAVTDTYRKVHLTPYGEYLPFDDLLRPLLRAAKIPYSALSPGQVSRPLRLPDGIQAGISICYEDVFGNEWRQQLPEAMFLINITNDAWFDKTIMPHQHLQMAQARALESGRYLARATNTGITAIADPGGQIIARLPDKVRGILSEEITLYRGATPYVLLGDAAVITIVLLILFGGALIRAYRFYQQWQAKKKQNAAGE